ncbi:MAG: LamG domain-containing protein [Mastigocoleus sp.]
MSKKLPQWQTRNNKLPVKKFLSILGVATCANLIILTIPAFSQKHPGCWMISEKGSFNDLNNGQICPKIPNSLQATGDINSGTLTSGILILSGPRPFKSKQDYLTISENSNLNLGTGDFTITAWVKTTQKSGIQVIVDKRVETSGPVKGYVLANYRGKLLLQLADSVGKEWTNYVSNVAIADGKWHHVAVTVDRDQKQGGRWYIDGKPVSKTFNPTGRQGSLDNPKPLVVGKRSDNPGWSGLFKGNLANIYIFKRVLSPQEIVMVKAKRQK